MSKPDWAALDAVARRVLHEHHQVAHLSRFVAAGISPNQVGALRARGVVRRARKGWYVDPALPAEAVRAVRVGGVLGGVSAARSWGLPLPEDASTELQVSLADNASRLRHSRDSTWQVDAGEEEGVRWLWLARIQAVRGYRSSVADTLLQLALLVPLPWLVAAMDRALHAARGEFPMIDPESWERVLVALPTRLQRAWHLADGRSESPIETLLRVALIEAGIALDIQVWVVPWYRVDILIGGWLVIEADGMGKYLDPEQIERDRERDAQLAAWGYHVLRFSYRQIIDSLPWVVGVITDVLGRRAA